MDCEKFIAGRIKVGPKIGSGSFGEIHSVKLSVIIGIRIDTGEEIAIKLVLCFNY